MGDNKRAINNIQNSISISLNLLKSTVTTPFPMNFAIKHNINTVNIQDIDTDTKNIRSEMDIISLSFIFFALFWQVIKKISGFLTTIL